MTRDPQSETPLRDDEINCPGCGQTTDISEFDEELDRCSSCLQNMDEARTRGKWKPNYERLDIRCHHLLIQRVTNRGMLAPSISLYRLELGAPLPRNNELLGAVIPLLHDDELGARAAFREGWPL